MCFFFSFAFNFDFLMDDCTQIIRTPKRCKTSHVKIRKNKKLNWVLPKSLSYGKKRIDYSVLIIICDGANNCRSLKIAILL